MKVPLEWLKELVPIKVTAEKLAELIALGGLETHLISSDILEVDILPNRADCWSLRGIAREVAALTKVKVKAEKPKVNETAEKTKKFVQVDILEPELCSRYMARVIKNVKVDDSPDWLKHRLEKAGVRSINNVVDVTNYLMLEIGQPMHAFDASLVKDRHIVVRRAEPKEKVLALDGKEYQLDSEVLVIADPDKAIAIAGIMGLANSEVRPTTTTIILESAFFNPVSIHENSRKLKLRSESSVRFAHGLDWLGVEEALDRGAALIAELAGGEVLSGSVDAKKKDPTPKNVLLRPARVEKILGEKLAVGTMTSILKGLGFGVKTKGNDLVIEIPLFRAMDLEREADLIEEIVRVNGFDKIKPTMPDTSFPGKKVPVEDHQKIRHSLVGCGLNEAQTYTLVGSRELEHCLLSAEHVLPVENPLNADQIYLRPSLLPGLLRVVERNQNRQIENVLLFEIGKSFAKNGDKLPRETYRVAAVATGSPFRSLLDKGTVDYFFLKGVIENLFASIGLELPELKESASGYLQVGSAAEIPGIGFFGALNPEIQRNFELKKPLFAFEFDLDALLGMARKGQIYRQLPKYPNISRDISLTAGENISNQRIIDLIKEVGGPLTEAVFPFDKFKESVAYRVVYRHQERTLTEAEVNQKHQEITAALVAQLNVKLR
ncbi:phenylalanine--tRNA ligase subunit beta [candidate division WOR-1 bacterium RIFOXYA12_FULL_52_29]|uniref:Phenylalanine--tRNA ligase beta subunit n=1 Tax=candidate division WOR-1 bacterium RIFOXYC12_FULL_54_18 TaxID=1802584 RepID=A0A1F4T4W8_UNCSA|nr:MAG: phenylalanine--tRNA ligase subunit beta [candidate division WOR-1 bacterium RIFOXYA2_FULL_51_19]OGC17189.1 MAG: phenylalanine--tRNA ligase subunit beta [candidate division WOR-1 bacterium RIFOXYA12_FULL_52_29]OGC26049.1 MAG: phenylalanine--tRNA ligase subunit beta [candidate division WOR-1 bacterium RIFOXYB2_FULL_45_9]OGC27606.1 MAG: phenylalanine--tRNA ligase subunit beta [candidate division WOR-1 bacterium RIFOXYC12_FULL_54_18]OGC29180.1 MAG: phenylalanine--tRNA ligase subunit beta [c